MSTNVSDDVLKQQEPLRIFFVHASYDTEKNLFEFETSII